MMNEGESLIENYSDSKSLGDLNVLRDAFNKWCYEIIVYIKETCALDVYKKISKINQCNLGFYGPSNEQVVAQ